MTPMRKGIAPVRIHSIDECVCEAGVISVRAEQAALRT